MLKTIWLFEHKSGHYYWQLWQILPKIIMFASFVTPGKQLCVGNEELLLSRNFLQPGRELGQKLHWIEIQPPTLPA